MPTAAPRAEDASREAPTAPRLTPRQKALVESVMPLAYRLAAEVARKYGVDLDEAASDAAYQVVRAALRYDPSRGAWTTCAYLAVKLFFREYHLRRLNRRRYLLAGDRPARARHDGRAAPAAGVAEPPVGPSPCQDGTAHEVHETVLAVSRRLTPLEFAILWRHHGLGETLAEIGRATGRCHQTVGHALMRARTKLRRCPEAADATALVGRHAAMLAAA